MAENFSQCIQCYGDTHLTLKKQGCWEWWQLPVASAAWVLRQVRGQLEWHRESQLKTNKQKNSQQNNNEGKQKEREKAASHKEDCYSNNWFVFCSLFLSFKAVSGGQL